ncbi:ABC transporter ATP-binding protein [Cellulosilyticum ruminicola]|uniref:ABC transporter ATP-binding protein n=1 Tax=Cellulosilyticum ruminicola TaxID=425254 RepID=UPI0006D297CC|nr:ABC transporter ATP-binding protein [Cellulosilyticum ruminicola]
MQVELKNVSKTIHKSEVLKNVSYTFESGKIYGLIGKNGSGKTMLIRTICGLLHPTQGQVIIADKPLDKNKSFPESVGILIESPSFIDAYNGFQNLKLIAGIKQLISDEDIVKALESVGLGDKMHLKYKKYSLGMKQRLGIACAIMENPKILLLDEPTNALDESGLNMLEGLLQQAKANNSIVIVASHDKEMIDKISDETLTLRDGKMIEGSMTK